MFFFDTNVSNVENLSPQIIRQVSKEISGLCQNPPEGIKVFMNDEDVTDIQATIEGPAGTPYAGGNFQMKLVLGNNFPAEPPKAFFLTKIFHPNVSSNGEICVNTLKKDWKPELGIKHILLTVKCLLIVPNPESALNAEAGKLLLEQYEDYSQRAKMFTEIHAKPLRATEENVSTEDKSVDGPLAKKHAGDKKLLDKKKRDKKKTLKRL
ncbi:ubiquitin-conjugating enzyme E2 S-like isoform X1 [Biomphalaria glabrata]|uniref:E2 ubiquitin-conjugating enzyme n=1 Tax=Biomphalaria glabrata TaxID=6526 RepID=A0A2C9K524_BIOGL|nr:ubiquitin-conjugating enzyme E2 S-like isoform X1 [Biomphalaria glabrata]